MLLLGVDTETTGLGNEARIVQLAWAVADTTTWKIVESQECLVYGNDYPPVTAEAYGVHGLDADFLKKFSSKPFPAMWKFAVAFAGADCVVAHNGYQFDFPLLKLEWERCKIEGSLDLGKCIDTKVDVKYPEKMRSHSLRHLALDHGIIVDPKRLHSALYDVTLMLDVLSHYDINEVIERSKSPIIKVIAEVPRDQNHLLKEQRFRWNADKREWWRECREVDLEDFLKKCKFKTRLEK